MMLMLNCIRAQLPRFLEWITSLPGLGRGAFLCMFEPQHGILFSSPFNAYSLHDKIKKISDRKEEMSCGDCVVLC